MSPSTLKVPPRPQPDWPWPAEEVTQLRGVLASVQNILRKERLLFWGSNKGMPLRISDLVAAVAQCERICQEALDGGKQ